MRARDWWCSWASRRDRPCASRQGIRTADENKPDYHADPSSVPYILDEFTYFFETPYDVTDKSFNQCTLDRPGGASANGRMYIVNHFLDVDIFGILIPDQINAPKTNSRASILAQSNLCYQTWGRLPNFILVSIAFRPSSSTLPRS